MSSGDDNQAMVGPDQARALQASIAKYETPGHLSTGIGMLLDAEERDSFRGAGAAPFSPEQQRILGRPLTDQEIHIRPDDGMLYLPGVYYRRRLNEAFGMGGWALVPVGDPARDTGGNNPTVFYTGRLYTLGRFAAQATGKGTFITGNAKSDYGTALESARTDCLTRCCKDWIATELWDPDVADGWRTRNCQKIKNPDPQRFGARAVYVWVKNSDPMFAPTVPVQLPPNVPPLRTDRTTGQPIMGAWPHYIPNPVADAERRLDDDYRRVMDVAPRSDLEVQLQRSIDENTIEVIDRRTGEVTKETKATKAQIARIHILIRETNYGDEAYRANLKKYYAVDTSALLTKAQAEDAILRLERTKARAVDGRAQAEASMLRVLTDGGAGEKK